MSKNKNGRSMYTKFLEKRDTDMVTACKSVSIELCWPSYGISHINCTWLHVSCTYRIIFNFSTRISETNVCWKSKIFRKSIIFSDLLKVLETRILSLDLEYLIYCGAPTRTNLKLVRSKISFHIRMIFISNISISPFKIILWFSRLEL